MILVFFFKYVPVTATQVSPLRFILLHQRRIPGYIGKHYGSKLTG
jgi:hypothetical protein